MNNSPHVVSAIALCPSTPKKCRPGAVGLGVLMSSNGDQKPVSKVRHLVRMVGEVGVASGENVA